MDKEKQNRFWLIAACLSIAPFLFTAAFYTPALGAIAKAFPDTPTSIIQSISTIASLGTAIVAFFYGQLASRFSSRKIALAAIVIVTIGSIVPAFGGGMAVILGCRILTGFGTGLMFPLANKIFFEFFTGNDTKALIGIKGTVGNIASMIFSLIGGFLAAIYWRNAFWAYLIMIIPIAIIIFKLPESEIIKAEQAEKTKITPAAWGLLTYNLLFNVFMIAFQLNIAIIISKLKLGTPADAGMVMTVWTAFSALAGLTYLPVSKLFKKYINILPFVYYTAGFAILIYANTLSVFYIAAVLVGLGFGTYNAAFTLATADSVQPSAVSTVLGYYATTMKIGQFAAPFVLAYLLSTFQLQGPKAAFLLSEPFFIGSLIIGFFILILRNTKKTENCC
jgi:Arabinose efflux permease